MSMLKRRALPVIVLILMLACVLSLRAGTRRNTRVGVEQAWSLPFPGAQGAVFTVLSPGGRPVVVVQTPREIALVTPEGRLARSLAVPDLIALATGDLDGDGGDEIVLLRRSPPRLEALNAELKPLWSAPLASPAPPARVLSADLDGDGRAEVVAGGPPGLDAFAPDGRALWSYRFQGPAAGDKGELRGLDDARGGGARRVATARRDGSLVVLDAAGRVLVERAGPEIRRLRAGDADGDRRDEVLIGRDSGAYEALGEDGHPRVNTSLGEAVVELRKVDLDGRRETGEIALGGKRGAVKVLRGDKVVMWAETGVRVSDLAGVDTDGDGRDELVVGCEDGSVFVYSAAGARLAAWHMAGKPDRILPVGLPGGPRQILVAGGPTLSAYSMSTVTAPAWYSPVTAGVLGVLGFGALGFVLRRVRPPVRARPDTSADIATAPQRAAQARLQELIASGHVSPEQAAERLEQLARQAAAASGSAGAGAAPPPPPRPSPPPPPRRA
jgi:hypothetical protein